MATYKARFSVPATVIVKLDVELPEGMAPEDFDFEDAASDQAWTRAQDYLRTLTGDHQGVTIEIDLDGIGADTVEEV